MDADQFNFEAKPAMITGAQVRAGRGLLGWSVERMIRECGVSESTIRRAEMAEGVPKMRTDSLLKIQTALERGGCLFVADNDLRPGGAGVRFRR